MRKGDPDRELAISKYGRIARTYDRRTRWGDALRLETILKLELRTGDVVLDVGCGTGINFSMLHNRIGPEGTIVGIELSAEMLQEAERRISNHGWGNVELIQAPAEEADISKGADAVLFGLTHDILQSHAAISNVMGHVRPGGRVASLGAKWAPRWALPVNLAVWLIARRYVTTFKGFDRPWASLAEHVPDLKVESVAFGAAYLAWGVKG
jgi:ubiquinone/menaquinone biosynthesis C-methylase UbiE